MEVLVTLADYDGNTAEGELSFVEGDYVLLLKKDESGWYQGDIGGTIGWFPSNYVRETTRDEYEAYCLDYQIAPYLDDVEVEDVQVCLRRLLCGWKRMRDSASH